MNGTRELRQRKLQLAEEARAILTAAKTAGRGMTTEEDARFDAIHVDIEKLTRDIEREERQQAVEAETAARQEERAEREGKSKDQVAKEDEEVRATFVSYLRGGRENLSPEQRAIFQKRWAMLSSEGRAQSVGTTTAGGFTVPIGFYNQLIDAQKLFGGMRDAGCTILTTDAGNDIQIALDDDTANVGAILAENVQVGTQDVAFTQKTIKSYMYTSKLILVSLQLLQDSAFDVEAFIKRMLARRIGRALNAHFTTGTGTGQPQGIITGAATGDTGAVGNTLTVPYASLVNLEHSVDPVYRKTARWMFADSTLKVIKKMVDGQSRPLWLPGFAVPGTPDQIMGYPYVINQDVAAMGVSAKSIAFGDFSSYLIRDVVGAQVLRLEERYADFLQVGFVAFERHDGLYADAGAGPVKLYVNSAT